MSVSESSPDETRLSPYGFGQVRRGLMHFLIGRGTAAVFGFVAAILLVRYLPIKDYAVFATLAGLQIVAVALASFGLDQVITRFVPMARLRSTPAVLVRLIWTMLAWRVGGLSLVILMLAMLSPWIIELLNISGFESAYWVMLVYIALFGLSQHVMRSLQALMVQRMVKWAQFWEFFSRFVMIAVWSSTHGYEMNVVESIWILLACSLLGFLILLTSLVHHLKILIHQEGEWLVMRNDIYRLGWDNYLQTLLLLPTEVSSLRLIAAYFLAPPAMAAYGFFLTLSSTVRRYLPIQLLLDMAEPVMLAKYVQSNEFHRLLAMTNFMIKITVYLLAPLIVWVMLSGAPMIGFLTGGKYEEYVWLLSVLLIALLFDSHWIMLRTICNAVGMSSALAKGALVSLVGLVPLLGIISSWPLPEVFVSGALIFVILQNLIVVKILRGAGHLYTLDWKGLRRISVAIVMTAGVGWYLLYWINLNGLWETIASSFVMIAVYLMTARWLQVFSREEREMLARINRRLVWVA